MKKLFSKKTYIPAVLIIFSIFFFLKRDMIYGSSGNKDENLENKQSRLIKSSEPEILGKIGDYSISSSQLRARLLLELDPGSYQIYTMQTKPADANSMLLRMLGEKAIIIDARRNGLLAEETIHQAVSSYNQKQMVSLWVKDNIQRAWDKIAATEDEINRQLKADPKMNRQQAKSAVEAAKTDNLLNTFYIDLCKKFQVKKVPENYAKAAKLYDRLLNHPQKPQKVKFVQNEQIKEELTEDERNIVLATFSQGKITVKDWFETICESSPPSRPDNLNTEKGVEQLLDKALATPIIVLEVQLTGLDKDTGFQKKIRDYADDILLNTVKGKKYAEVKEPNESEIVTFCNNNKDYFITDRILKIDQIWCKDLETAKRVKAEISAGKNFDEAKKEYSLYPGGQAHNVYPGTEGFFWKDIWAGEPNEITGPVKGYQTDGIKWRIVKILEKKSGHSTEYSSNLENAVKYLIMNEQGDKIFANYCLETLKKYSYEVYSDKIKDIDPMNIP